MKKFVVALAILVPAISHADIIVYSNDFESATGPELSLVSRAFSSHFTNFSGRFSNVEQTLTLALDPGRYQVAFDAYIIDSWDGYSAYGPDRFGVRLNGSLDFFHYFSNVNSSQTYWGAGQRGSFGFSSFNDAIYRIVLPFDHPGGAATIAFLGTGLQGISDESWGVDNIEVTRKNTAPVAEASVPSSVATDDVFLDLDPDTLNLRSNGRFVTAYMTVDPNGTAQITLDGSASTDSDNDDLNFTWSVTDAASRSVVRTAAGKSAALELPAGSYEVELTVSDGHDWSSKKLPLLIGLMSLSTLSSDDLLLNGVAASTVKLEGDRLMAKFDRATIASTLSVGDEVEVLLTGKASGTDTIQVTE